LPYIWVAQCLSQTIQNLIKNKASWGGGGGSNLDHKGLAHVTRKICTPSLENTQQKNPTLKHPTQRPRKHP